MAIIGFSPQALAGFLADGLRAALSRGPFASLAVSGGRTPESVFPLLAQEDLDWGRVWITLTDERWLPPHLEGSNEELTRRLLLRDKAAKARFVGFWSDAASPEAALPALEYRLGQMPWPLDVLFLGMGADGHIASLFPESPALEEDTSRVAATLGMAPFHVRISLTLPVLTQARKVALAANSPEKRDVLSKGDARLPVHRFLALSPDSVTIFG